jgi:hypothetical protein
MEKTHDRRKLVRDVIDTTLEFKWTDIGGGRHTAVGTARDASADGLSGVFPTPLPAGQVISVEFRQLGIFGHGVVRHSTPLAGEFLIGMAYIGELHSR